MDLRERLRWPAAGGINDRATMARTFIYFFTGGATLGLLMIALPHPADVNEVGLAAPCVLAYAGVAVFLIGFDRLPLWVFHAQLAGAVVLVAVAAYYAGPTVGTWYAVLYTWTALTAFTFFSLRQASAYVALIAVAVAVVLAMSDDQTFALKWSFLMGTVCVAGFVIGLLRARLETAVRTDPLTGLLNRRGLDERFDLELARARRDGCALGLVVVDVDRFKQVNDRHGHQAGDRALVVLADVLRDRARAVDAPARLGGEEFAVLMPGADADGALALAERIRTAATRASGATEAPFTVSCGVASLPPVEATKDALLGQADRALYSAKEHGRDRSVAWVREPQLRAVRRNGG